MIWYSIDVLEHHLLIVHPESEGALYREYQEPDPLLLAALARRLFASCRERSWEIAVCSSRELLDMTTDQLSRATPAVVDPLECAATSGDEPVFFSKLSSARKRIMVLAEAVESTRYGQQFRLPTNFDAVFDVGFVSQRDKHLFPEVPYHFVFNGPTREEEQVLAELSPSQERCIPWAVVGPRTPNYLNLVAELMDYKLYPGGFCFLQHPSHQGRKGAGLLSYSGLSAVLSKTKYYVWSSDDSSAYYESFRFLQALLVGAVPCKIDGGHSWEGSGIPGIFPSVRSFCARMQDEDHWSMYCSSREFYMSKGLLAEHLEKALRLV
jgi:hypothetical protein